MKKWLMKNRKPVSLQDPDIRDHCVKSLRFPPDGQKWAEYGKDDLSSAIIGHILEVNTSCLLPLLFLFPYSNCLNFYFFLSASAKSTSLEG